MELTLTIFVVFPDVTTVSPAGITDSFFITIFTKVSEVTPN